MSESKKASGLQRHQHLLDTLRGHHHGVLPHFRSDYDALKDQHRFIRSPEEDAEREAQGGSMAAEVRLARRYYEKLYREYAIADMSRYREGLLGLRWRIEKEVISGKGQFTCGAKGCDEEEALSSYEVPFTYKEAGESKTVLIKLRTCPVHAAQLCYKKKGKRKRENDEDDEFNRLLSSL